MDYCELLSKLITDLLRCSINEDFRKECMHTLGVTNATDAEEVLKKILKMLKEPRRNTIENSRSTHKHDDNLQVVHEVSEQEEIVDDFGFVHRQPKSNKIKNNALDKTTSGARETEQHKSAKPNSHQSTKDGKEDKAEFWKMAYRYNVIGAINCLPEESQRTVLSEVAKDINVLAPQTTSVKENKTTAHSQSILPHGEEHGPSSNMDINEDCSSSKVSDISSDKTESSGFISRQDDNRMDKPQINSAESNNSLPSQSVLQNQDDDEFGFWDLVHEKSSAEVSDLFSEKISRVLSLMHDNKIMKPQNNFTKSPRPGPSQSNLKCEVADDEFGFWDLVPENLPSSRSPRTVLSKAAEDNVLAPQTTSVKENNTTAHSQSILQYGEEHGPSSSNMDIDEDCSLSKVSDISSGKTDRSALIPRQDDNRPDKPQINSDESNNSLPNRSVLRNQDDDEFGFWDLVHEESSAEVPDVFSEKISSVLSLMHDNKIKPPINFTESQNPHPSRSVLKNENADDEFGFWDLVPENLPSTMSSKHSSPQQNQNERKSTEDCESSSKCILKEENRGVCQDDDWGFFI